MLACCKPCYAKTTARIPTAVMIFFACFISYAVRLSLNIAIMAMVFPQNLQKGGGDCNPDPPEKSNVTKEPPDYGPRNDWSTAVQGHVKAAYGYGYFVAHFPAGVLADLAGPRLVMVAAAVAMGVLTALLPLAAGLHWGAVFALRVIAGLAGGIVYPCMHALVAQWSPPHEKGKFMFALMGGSFSSVVTMPLAGFITETLGWPAVFYVTSAGCGFFCLVWLLTVFDSPALHPAISDVERDFILESLGDAVKVKKPPVPLKRVLASVPFWGLVILHYGNLWGLFLLTTDTPIFLHEVLGFSIKESGGINSLPTLGRCIMSLISGSVVDVIVTKQLWKNKGTMRKFFVLFSHIVPGALMLGLAFVGCNVPGAIALLTIGLSFNGASTVTNLVNHHDLAPNYAGSLYGFMNGFGATTLWIVPSVTGAILESHNGLQEWKTIYLIGSGLYLVAGVIFIAFGSAEIQEWNNSDEDSKVESEKKMESAPPQEDPVVTPDPIIASDAQVQEAK